MLIFAFLVGISMMVKRGCLLRINPRITIELGIFILISAFIGARLLYVFENLDWYMAHPSRIIFSRSGFVFYGGLFLSIMVSFCYLHKNKPSFLLMGDIITPSLAIGEAIGRIGCLLAGCWYGRPTDLAWGIHFLPSSLPYLW